MKQEIEYLRAENDRVATALRQLKNTLSVLADVVPVRSTAIARTKIDEASMWLEKYQEKIQVELACKTCR